jgi:hypothetical protein
MSNTCASIRGIKSTNLPRVQQLDIEGSVDKSDVLLESDGTPSTDPGCRETYNSRVRITMNGKGALPSSVAAGGGLEVTGYTGGITGVSATEEEQETGQHFRWNAEATNWPYATAVS